MTRHHMQPNLFGVPNWFEVDIFTHKTLFPYAETIATILYDKSN